MHNDSFLAIKMRFKKGSRRVLRACSVCHPPRSLPPHIGVPALRFDRYEGYFCRDVSGDILNDPAVLSPAFAASCAAVAPTTAYDRMDIYIKDWRNASLRTWWLDEVIGRVISSEVIDGFYWVS